MALGLVQSSWCEDPDEVPPISPNQLQLSSEAVEILDISTVRVTAELGQSGLWVPAEVLSLAPLIALRSRYVNVEAARQAAAVESEVAMALVGRLGRLREQGENAKLGELETAQKRLKTAQAQVRAAEAEHALIALTTRLDWGESFVGWVVGQAAEPTLGLWSGEALLLRIDLPQRGVSEGAPETLELHADGLASRMARRLAPARTTSNRDASASWLYSVAGSGLAAGQRLLVWWPVGEPGLALSVPISSIVWFGGRPWVWQVTGNGGFRRLPVELGRPQGDSRVSVRSGLAAGMELVTQGGAELLGEELKAAIPDEDDD